MRKICAILLMVFLSVSIFASQGYATGDQNFIRKASRGLDNMGFFWFEIFQSVSDTNAQFGPLAGSTYGFAKGFAKAGFRMMIGIYETVTCLIPPYGPILKDPEFFVSRDLDERYPTQSPIMYVFEQEEE